MPLDPDIDDDKIERLAREKGVGKFERPQPEEKGAPVAIKATNDAAEATIAADDADQPTPRSRMKTLNLELPDYVWTELKIRAAQRQTSLRHVVMAALVKDDVTIAKQDMIEDGRRLR
ncbi:MAG TPA: hypothetical protein VGN80_09825 [Devosiaceae bacterium]|jgi:hypothetical protein|nr:hypothetical protein [Devosiaceae bacterium]